MADYRYARSPRWIAGHALALGLVVLMVALGFWQLRRLDERRDRNALVEQQAAQPPAPVESLVEPGDGALVTDGLRFRAVSAAGEYDVAATTTVRATQDGAPGGYVLTPLELDGGRTVVVLRGFAGTDAGGDVVRPAPPPGQVQVEGIVVPVDRLDRPTRTAIDNVAVAAGDLLPVVLQASASQPADAADQLLAVPRPDLGDGPHLGYAVQWFLFSAVGVVGYPLLLRRRARDGT
ncbi:MAG: SURF1 family protein [Acidimicrobiia bacterium]|nr:SURF1 family protein [Acidimicrobiia bacterium]